MSLLGGSMITVGIVIFLVGYWFLGKSQGEESCTPPNDKAKHNKGGGIAGIVIGIIFVIVGFIINLSQPKDLPQYA